MFSESRDRGAALILTIGWSAVILLIAGTVSAAVTQQIRKSDNAETSYQALSAAEAGVEDIRARLAVDSDYWRDLNTDENPALAGWVSIPGEDTSAQFTYFVDTSAAERSGRIRVTSSGRAFEGGEVRSVDVLLQKRNSTEYAYLSDSEAFPYDQPDVYGLGEEATEGGGSRRMSQAVAEILCGTGGEVEGSQRRYWYQWANWSDEGTVRLLGPKTSSSLVDPSEIEFGASHRNSVACLFGEVKGGDVFDGPVHTNDVWYVNPGSQDNDICDHDPNAYPVECLDNTKNAVVFKGPVTSSCPDWSDENPNGCNPDQRWIDSSTFQEAKYGDPAAIDDVAAATSGSENRAWNPGFESVLEMPSLAQVREIKNFAYGPDGRGCVFSGPTRIRMGTNADGAGVLYVTSPNTKDGGTNPNPTWCGSGYYADDPSSKYESSHTTKTLSYEEMLDGGFNGVIYIEDVESEDVEDVSEGTSPPSCFAGDDPDTKLPYPWISPETDSEEEGGRLSGFPSADTTWYGILQNKKDDYDLWTDKPERECSSGHLYLEAIATEGGYTGQYTIGADGDIALTDDVLEHSVVAENRATSAAGSLWGCPLQACEGETQEGTSDNQLGLVPAGWMYVYKPGNLKQSAPDQGILKNRLKNVTLNFASLAADKCLAVQDFDSNAYNEMGDVRVVGSVGQGARCHLANPGGSGFNQFLVSYDERLKRLGAPPFMPFLSGEPWAAKSWSETEVRRDFEAKKDVLPRTQSQSRDSSANYSVVPSGSSMTLLYARVIDGAGSVTSNSETGVVSFTAPNAVLTSTIEFVVAKEDGTRVGQTLTVTVG